MAKTPNRGMDRFRGRTLIIATQHGKEEVIAPELFNSLGVNCKVVSGLNTDQFGTFSGEIKRKGTALEAAQKKAHAALALSEASLVVASEGSFGPHPYYSFIPGNEELLLFIDQENNLTLVARYLTTETNYAHQAITAMDQLKTFCEQMGFPEHGLILKANHPDKAPFIYKDLRNEADLFAKSTTLLNKGYTLMAETDMRAMRNPTRMKAIHQATIKLVQLLQSECPQCQAPGFARTEAIEGLPCQLCGSPTRTAKAYVYSCSSCGHQEEHPREDKTFEDPMYCDVCNP